MKGNKTIEILKTFSVRQINSFDRFLNSPYYNKRNDLINLYQSIIKFYPAFSDQMVTKEVIYQTVFDQELFDYKKLSYLLNDLQNLLDRFIIVEAQNSEFDHQLMLLKYYGKNNFSKGYKKALKQAEKIIYSYPFHDAEKYYQTYLLEAEKNASFNRELKRTMDPSLQDAIDNLDIYYLATKLKYSCEILNRQNVITTDYQLNLVSELQSYLKAFPFQDHPVVHIYYMILMSLQHVNEPTYFKTLMKLLDQHSTHFSNTDSREMYLYALNYCARQINLGKREYLKRLFGIYQNLIDNDLLLIDSELSPWTFKNIVLVGLRLDKIGWVESFIHDYIDYLDIGFRKDALKYNLGYVQFKKGEYGKALELLQEVEFTDIYYSVDSKVLLLKIYFEQQQMDVLLSHLDTFQTFLKRNKKVSDNMKEVYLNLVKYVRKNFKLTNEKQILDLLKEVKTQNKLADSAWLIGQLEKRLINK